MRRASRRAQARLVLAARLLHRTLKLRPFMNPAPGGLTLRRGDAALRCDHSKRVEKRGRRTAVSVVQVKRFPLLCQRPNRAAVIAKRHSTQMEGAAPAELVQKLVSCERAHRSRTWVVSTEERTRHDPLKRRPTLAKESMHSRPYPLYIVYAVDPITDMSYCACRFIYCASAVNACR